MRYRRLVPAGPEVSELGFGASPLGGIYVTFAERDGIAAVHAALDAGINIFDVAPYYGLTAAETVLGKALRGIDRARYILATRIALQFAVATSPCVTTVVGSASASHVERDVAWIGEPIDVGMLAEVEAILAPVRGIGWASGRPENQNPAPLPRRRRSWTVMCT